MLAFHLGGLVIHTEISQVRHNQLCALLMLRDHQIEYPWLTVLHRLKDHGKILLRGRIFAQPRDALQRGPGNQDPILYIFLKRLEDKDGAGGHSQIAKLILLTILINLLLTSKHLHVCGLIYKVTQIVDLAQVESANLVKIVLY